MTDTSVKFGETISEGLTGRLQWLQTYDLDNISSGVLQQEWYITTIMGGRPVSQTTEWRNVPVVNGGLKV